MRSVAGQGSSGVPTLSSAWVRGVVRLFESVGLDVPRLFGDAGLDFDLVSNPDGRHVAERVSTLWELAVARSGNPYLGLAMPDMAHPGSVDVIVHVMMTCPNLLAAIERFLRYMRIVSDVADIKLLRTATGYGMTMQLSGMDRAVPKARMDFMVVTLLNILRWLTGLNLRPLAVDFPYPPPPDLQPYRLAFPCPLRFDAPTYQLHFSEADMTAPLPTSNPSLAAFNDRMATEHLGRLGTVSVSARVKYYVVQRLPDGDPLRAEIAREMNLSERTLQRRLHREGTSFNDLVDATRRERADQYLRVAGISLTQVAYVLGFADQSTFYRSCKRWFGTSPGEYRARLAAVPGKPAA